MCSVSDGIVNYTHTIYLKPTYNIYCTYIYNRHKPFRQVKYIYITTKALPCKVCSAFGSTVIAYHAIVTLSPQVYDVS